MPDMTFYDLVRYEGEWVLKRERGGQIVDRLGDNREAAVKAVAKKARQATAEEPVSIRFHGEDGKIQEERTYPRSADPSPPKGAV